MTSLHRPKTICTACKMLTLLLQTKQFGIAWTVDLENGFSTAQHAADQRWKGSQWRHYCRAWTTFRCCCQSFCYLTSRPANATTSTKLAKNTCVNLGSGMRTIRIFIRSAGVTEKWRDIRRFQSIPKGHTDGKTGPDWGGQITERRHRLWRWVKGLLCVNEDSRSRKDKRIFLIRAMSCHLYNQLDWWNHEYLLTPSCNWLEDLCSW